MGLAQLFDRLGIVFGECCLSAQAGIIVLTGIAFRQKNLIVDVRRDPSPQGRKSTISER
jgi:hypothetical protein